MKKQVSVKDIAKELNISLSTVHKAMTGKGGISEERRKEVLKTAKKMGYQVNSVAQTLARKSINIGIIMPSLWQDYFAAMKDGMIEEAEKLKTFKVSASFYYLSSDITEKEAEKALKWIKDGKIDAIIYCPSIYSMHEAFATAIKKSKIPVFIAGDSFDEIESVCEIMPDSILSGKIAADFLKCIKGNDIKAAVFTGSLSVKSHREKVMSFSERIKSFGGEISFLNETLDDGEKTYEMAKCLSDSQVNAVYVTTATFEPVCRYIEENLKDKDIALIATDVPEGILRYMQKGIVKGTIYQNQEKVGKSAVMTAYEYLVQKSSYGNENFKSPDKISVRPCIYLLSDVE